MSIAVLAETALSVASGVLGAKYKQGLTQAEELIELLNKIVRAAEDNAVTEAEFRDVVTNAHQVLGKARANLRVF